MLNICMIEISMKDIISKTPSEILQHIYAHKDGFYFLDIPTLLLSPPDFSAANDREEIARLADGQWEQFRHKLLKSGSVDKGIYYEEKKEKLYSSIEGSQDPQWDNASAFPARVHKLGAHEYDDLLYTDPEWNIVLGPHQNEQSKVAIRDILGNSQYDQLLPGSPEEEHLFIIFHELAHGTGAAEPQADKMAATLFKCVAGNNAYLKMKSDWRLLKTIFNYDSFFASSHDPLKRYPVSMSQGLDDVVGLSQATINQMTDDDIKAIRFENPAPRLRETCNFGGAFKNKDYDIFCEPDLPKIARMANRLGASRKNAKLFDMELPRRFALACKRIHIGGAAYTNSEDPYDIAPEVLEEVDRMEGRRFKVFQRWTSKNLTSLGF